jgi:hypothetical protein
MEDYYFDTPVLFSTRWCAVIRYRQGFSGTSDLPDIVT